MRIAKIALFMFMLLGVAVAETGNQFNTKCFLKPEDNIEAFTDGYCDGYISGVLDTTILTELIKDTEGRPLSKQHVCMSGDVTHSQLFLIIKKYFSDSPEHLNWDAAMLVHNALIKAFPCK